MFTGADVVSSLQKLTELFCLAAVRGCMTCLLPLILLLALCVFLWRRNVRAAQEKNKYAAAAEGMRVLQTSRNSAALPSYSLLLQHCLAATGATCGYLALLTPEPHLVYATDMTVDAGRSAYSDYSEEQETVSAAGSDCNDSHDCKDDWRAENLTVSIPMHAKEFWAPLLEGIPFVVMNAPTTELPYCGYPLAAGALTGGMGRAEQENRVHNHLAVQAECEGVPTAIIGLGNGALPFTAEDAARASDLLYTLWSRRSLGEHACASVEETRLLESLVRRLPVGVALVDEKGVLLRGNAEVLRIYGLQEHDLPVSLASCVAPDERVRLEDALMAALHSAAEMENIRIRHKHTDGKHSVSRYSIRHLAEMRAPHFLILIEDIGAAESAERQLQEYQESLESMVLDRTIELKTALYFAESNRDKLEMILRSVGEGLLVTDMHNRVLLVNNNTERMLGVSLPHAVGRQVGQILSGKPYRVLLEEQISQTRTGEGNNFDLVVESSEGGERYLRATTAVVQSPRGERVGVVTIMHDTTQERELDRMKAEFVSMAAHELRTPLTTIQGFSEILTTRESLSEQEARHFLDLIRTSARLLTGIVSDLLDLSRIESGMGFRLRMQEYDLRELVTQQIEMYRVRAPEHTFVHVLADKPVNGFVDPHKFTQIIGNLLSNAVKYSPDGGTIDVRLDGDESTILLTVADEGIGMEQGAVARAFEKFYRAHGEDGGIQGAGLGLSIVKHLIEAHGGSIWLESELHEGTKVYVTLPTARQVDAMT